MASNLKPLLSECLKEATRFHSSKFSRSAIETLIKIHRNILCNNAEAKYREIRKENQQFYSKIWCSTYLQSFMHVCGWIEIKESLIFNKDENLLDIIDVLVMQRSIKPSEAEWVHETKHEGMSEKQLKELKLKQEAEKQRDKELEEYYKDKRFREELAARIKADIKADRDERFKRK